MQPGRGLQQLAERIAATAQGDGGRKYVLVLGQGCAAAAKVPSLPVLRDAWGEEVDDPASLEAILWSIEVPPFYYDIANLARAGYFPIVITTGYDRLLERALVDLGLRPGDQFEVVEPASDPEDIVRDSGRATELRIVHAHGLGERPVRGPAGLLDRATGRAPGDPLQVVLVGYEGESAALSSWIDAARGGDLWWANPDDARAERLGAEGWTGDTTFIDESEASPGTFFGQLALLLLRLPAIDALKQSEPPDERGDDWYTREYTQGRLHQAITVKRAIESSVASTSIDSVGQTQLTFQRQEIGRLEQQLASRDAVQRLLKRFHETASALRERLDREPDAVEPDTFDFLFSQISLLEKEGAKPQPNSAVVAAAEASLQSLRGTLGIRGDRDAMAR